MKLKKEIKTSSEARLILSRIKLVLSCIVLLKSVNALFEEALNENQNLLSASQKRIIHRRETHLKFLPSILYMRNFCILTLFVQNLLKISPPPYF